MSQPQPEIRRWWPAMLVDETVPPGRFTPEAWLSNREGGSVVVGDREADPDCLGQKAIPIEDGTVVDFVCADECPLSSLTIGEGGTWSIAPVPPLTASLYLRGEPETCSETVEQLVGLLRSDYGPGEYAIEARIWSGRIPFRFAAGGGLGTLTFVAGAH